MGDEVTQGMHTRVRTSSTARVCWKCTPSCECETFERNIGKHKHGGKSLRKASLGRDFLLFFFVLFFASVQSPIIIDIKMPCVLVCMIKKQRFCCKFWGSNQLPCTNHLLLPLGFCQKELCSSINQLHTLFSILSVAF